MFAAAVCGTGRGDCVTHRRGPLPDLTLPLWSCARRPSRCGSVSRPPGPAPPGPGRGTVGDYGAFVQGGTCLCAAFFRLQGLLHLRFIALKAGVFIPKRVDRILNRFGIHNLFVVHFPGIGLTQIAHAFGRGIDHHHVLVTLRFVLTPGVQGLFLLVFRTLTATVGAIDNQCRALLVAPFLPRKLRWRTAGQHTQYLQGLLHHRQQPLQPPVRTRLAQPK